MVDRKVVFCRRANLTTTPIDVFAGMGGTAQWKTQIPHAGCTLETAKSYQPCGWWCDKQACGNCHPNDNGYSRLAETVLAGLEPLPPAPPPPPLCRQDTIVGCFDDNRTAAGSVGMSPWLPSRQPQLHDRVTLENCAEACGGLELPLAGIEAGNHCSCGRSGEETAKHCNSLTQKCPRIL